MSKCGNSKYLTKSCCKLPIFAFETPISCIFPKKYNDFLEKDMYTP